jgi:hypothetical protein
VELSCAEQRTLYSAIELWAASVTVEALPPDIWRLRCALAEQLDEVWPAAAIASDPGPFDPNMDAAVKPRRPPLPAAPAAPSRSSRFWVAPT